MIGLLYSLIKIRKVKSLNTLRLRSFFKFIDWCSLFGFIYFTFGDPITQIITTTFGTIIIGLVLTKLLDKTFLPIYPRSRKDVTENVKLLENLKTESSVLEVKNGYYWGFPLKNYLTIKNKNNLETRHLDEHTIVKNVKITIDEITKEISFQDFKKHSDLLSSGKDSVPMRLKRIKEFSSNNFDEEFYIDVYEIELYSNSESDSNSLRELLNIVENKEKAKKEQEKLTNELKAIIA